MAHPLAQHYQRTFDHIVWMASIDRAYALDAAQRYELASEGTLTGLHDDVKAALPPVPTTKPTNPRRKSHGIPA